MINLTILLTLLILLIGSLMVAAPHIPNSTASEEANKEAYLSLTIIGSFVLIFGIFVSWKIFYGTDTFGIQDFIRDMNLRAHGVQIMNDDWP